MRTATKYAWAITLAAIGGAILLLKRSQSNPPSLITNDDMQTDPKLPRGYRNNNPLNIDYNVRNQWKGQLGIEPESPKYKQRFALFSSMPYGYRAALVLMRNYIKNYGLNTIFEIINRWAPSEDNNYPVSYAKNVCRIINEKWGSSVTPDTVVARNDKDTLTKMAYAMSIIENGNTEYTRMLGLPNMEIINEAWRLL